MYPRKKYRRRRKRGERRYKSTPILPIGLSVYAVVFSDRNVTPDRLPRRQWEWCRIVGPAPNRRKHHYLVRYNDQEAVVARRNLFIKGTNGRWIRVPIAAFQANRKALWWFGGNHPEECESQRPATELEVQAYADGIVPRAGWRIFDPDMNEMPFVHESETIWAAQPEPEEQEDALHQKREEEKTKRRAFKKGHAKKMLVQWERVLRTATNRVKKWKARVRYYEKEKS